MRLVTAVYFLGALCYLLGWLTAALIGRGTR